MATQDLIGEELSRLFRDNQESLARNFGCSTEDELIAQWEQTPPNERRIMLAAAARVDRCKTDTVQNEDRRKYFAKPGEAEWGC
jgi:hypothetical protein